MKKIDIKNQLLLLITGLFLMTACEYAYIEPEVIPLPDEVSFSTHIVPIFNQSCNYSPCHNLGGEPPDLTPANAYVSLFALNQIDTGNPEESLLYKIITGGGTMQKYITTPADADLILKWIQQGANNN
ncbi:hypothetical protein ACFL6I_19000 [candidate division KSB1 bacterium]